MNRREFSTLLGGADPAQAGYPVNPIEWVTKSASIGGAFF